MMTIDEKARCIAEATRGVKELHTDRFDHYFTTEKALVYEIDPSHTIAEIYDTMKLLIKEHEIGSEDSGFDLTISSLTFTVLMAVKLLRANNIPRFRPSRIAGVNGDSPTPPQPCH